MVGRLDPNGVAGMSDEMDAAGNDESGPSEDGVGRRLPPPAFPPGSRTIRVRQKDRGAESENIDGAFISPDEPLPERPEFPEDAFISPDAPIERSAEAADDDASSSPDEGGDADQVVVTGMGHDAHLEPEDIAMAGDPHVMEVSEVVSKLAADLKRKGEAGLRASPDMGRFEATLRGYCVGYLAGRRAEEDLPVLEESESGSW